MKMIGEIISAVEKEANVKLDNERFLLFKNAFRKNSLFLFGESEKNPCLFVRLYAGDKGEQRCRKEKAMLEFLAEKKVPNVLFPESIGVVKCGDGISCYIQRVIVSNPLFSTLPLILRRPSRRCFFKVTQHLIDIYLYTRASCLVEGKSYSLCYQHGDFWIGNLGTAGNKLVLYDFEYAKQSGLPLYDLLHFCLYYRIVDENIGKVGCNILGGVLKKGQDDRVFSPTARTVHDTFLGQKVFPTLVRRCITMYIERCNIKRKCAVELIKSYIEIDRGIKGVGYAWEEKVFR